jgi:putative membrane protein
MTIIHWLISTLAILIAAYIIPGVDVTLLGAIILAVVLGIINVFIKPVLTLLTLPLTIITLGLFSLVLNAVLIILAAAIVPGVSVVGFWAAFFFGILLALINALFSRID